MVNPEHCPGCGRTNPPDAQVCVCGCVLDPERRKREQEEMEIDTYQRVQEEKARRQAEVESASVVRIVDIKLTFRNVFGLTVQTFSA